MALLVQEIIEADYAFVFNTGNPSRKEKTEIYAEEIKLNILMLSSWLVWTSWIGRAVLTCEERYGFAAIVVTNDLLQTGRERFW